MYNIYVTLRICIIDISWT